jgi:hypothetical protein
MTHAVDGFSLALDFPVTTRNQKALWKMCHRFDEIVLDAGGRFYFAKDLTLRPQIAERLFGEERLAQLFRLKNTHDPEFLLQTNLARRLFPERLQGDSA